MDIKKIYKKYKELDEKFENYVAAHQHGASGSTSDRNSVMSVSNRNSVPVMSESASPDTNRLSIWAQPNSTLLNPHSVNLPNNAAHGIPSRTPNTMRSTTLPVPNAIRSSTFPVQRQDCALPAPPLAYAPTAALSPPEVQRQDRALPTAPAGPPTAPAGPRSMPQHGRRDPSGLAVTDDQHVPPPMIEPSSSHITIFVKAKEDDTPTSFLIHRNFLVFHSPVFKVMLSNGCEVLNILADPEVFSILVTWMYNQNLRDKHDCDPFPHTLVYLWVLAYQLQMPRLWNQVVELYVRIACKQDEVEGPSLQVVRACTHVYDNTSAEYPGSALRRLLTFQFAAFRSGPQMKVAVMMLPHEMVVDVACQLSDIHQQDVATGGGVRDLSALWRNLKGVEYHVSRKSFLHDGHPIETSLKSFVWSTPSLMLSSRKDSGTGSGVSANPPGLVAPGLPGLTVPFSKVTPPPSYLTNKAVFRQPRSRKSVMLMIAPVEIESPISEPDVSAPVIVKEVVPEEASISVVQELKPLPPASKPLPPIPCPVSIMRKPVRPAKRPLPPIPSPFFDTPTGPIVRKPIRIASSSTAKEIVSQSAVEVSVSHPEATPVADMPGNNVDVPKSSLAKSIPAPISAMVTDTPAVESETLSPSSVSVKDDSPALGESLAPFQSDALPELTAKNTKTVVNHVEKLMKEQAAQDVKDKAIEADAWGAEDPFPIAGSTTKAARREEKLRKEKMIREQREQEASGSLVKNLKSTCKGEVSEEVFKTPDTEVLGDMHADVQAKGKGKEEAASEGAMKEPEKPFEEEAEHVWDPNVNVKPEKGGKRGKKGKK